MAKRAMLVGCNYPGTNAALRGCINDVHSIHSMLTTYYGFEEGNIQTLIDTDESSMQPTGANIKKVLGSLVAESAPGDVLVFHFSGHGTQVADKDGGEADNKDEAIVPTDMNLICDDDLREILKPMKEGVKFTMISDCCHSGSMLDHPVQQVKGNKDPNAPPGGVGAIDPMQLMGMFFKDIPGGIVDDNKNRSMSTDLFSNVLSSKFGVNMAPGTTYKTLQGLFGSDSSIKAAKYLGMAQKFLESQAAKQSNTRNATTMSMLAKLLKMCLSATPTQSSAPGGEPNFAAMGATGGGGSTGGEAKTAAGVLITGCQANETSADACPSGDPKKAFGALTNALTTTVAAVKKDNPDAQVTNKQLVSDVRDVLLKARFAQNPCLECNDANVDSVFIC